MFNLNSNKIKLNNTLNFGYSYRYLEKQKHNLSKGSKQHRPKYMPNQSVMGGQLFGSKMDSQSASQLLTDRSQFFKDRSNSVVNSNFKAGRLAGSNGQREGNFIPSTLLINLTKVQKKE